MYTPEDVKKYYNTYTRKYLDIYGDVIQAFRPKNTNKLLEYLINSIGIRYKYKIIDAGCGVCGPAIFFAKNMRCNIDAITISSEQAQIASQKVATEKLQNYIQVKEGDYHQLNSYYPSNIYDGVVFLESLGHSNHPDMAIKQAYNCLKKDGFIYIKDFFIKKVMDEQHQSNIDRVINNMNKNYSYNALDLNATITSLRHLNMEIVFIKSFEFKDDTTIRANFETALEMDVFEDLPEFYPAEWLEIKCIKV